MCVLWQSVPNISFKELTLQVELGSSLSKTVYKAKWEQPSSGNIEQVAVLVFEPGFPCEHEIGMFQVLGKHPHLVRFMGVSLGPSSVPTNGSMCMLLELAPKGCLREVLQDLAETNQPATDAVLLTAAEQVRDCT
jgi:hypothetical protein